MYAMIMAGGIGTRFWPRSRREKPKQFLSIDDSKTMIQATVNRLSPLIPKNKIFYILNAQQKPQLVKQIKNIPEENIIVEPFGKNTAPCIGLAALHLNHIDPDGVMVVLPSDHIIKDKSRFQAVLKIGHDIALETNGLITLGITPDHPATGYGYIQHSDMVCQKKGVSVYKVKTFAEKPNQETAELFLKSGDFVWNSGMFIWKVSSILQEIRNHIPELYSGLEKLEKSIGKDNYSQQLEKFYRQIRSISIDYGVMEKAQNVYVIKCDIGWNDIGSWNEVYKLTSRDKVGNAIIGTGVAINSKNCFIHSDDDLIAVIGMNDVIVVKSENAILVCPRQKDQDVKDIVDFLKRKKMNDYL